jgi:hypothetical protein
MSDENTTGAPASLADEPSNAAGAPEHGVTYLKPVPTADAKTVDSTSDARVVNNVMRHNYRVLSDAEKQLMKSLKDTGLAFIEMLHIIGATDPAAGERLGSRELSVAQTKMEEAVMWAVKHAFGDIRKFYDAEDRRHRRCRRAPGLA